MPPPPQSLSCRCAHAADSLTPHPCTSFASTRGFARDAPTPAAVQVGTDLPMPPGSPSGESCRHQSVGEVGNQSVMAAHSTTRSRAIGSSFVGPKKATISKSDRMAPPAASILHQPNGTQIPTTARAARKKSPAAVTARKNPESGKPEDTVTWPSGPLSPPLQGQAHLNRPPNAPWDSLSRGTRYEAAK